jgi:hypothetical protein
MALLCNSSTASLSVLRMGFFFFAGRLNAAALLKWRRHQRHLSWMKVELLLVVMDWKPSLQ